MAWTGGFRREMRQRFDTANLMKTAVSLALFALVLDFFLPSRPEGNVQPPRQKINILCACTGDAFVQEKTILPDSSS